MESQAANSSNASFYASLNGWGSRTVDMFEKLEQVGEGTYGQVWKAKNKNSSEVVALKKVRMDNEKEGFPITAIREIKILKELDHENIITLKDIVTSNGKGSIFMVFEYMDHDLTGLMDSRQIAGKWFTLPQIKCYMKQLLEGLYYCHKNNVLHRDIKGSNLLINNQGQLKLADFGLARPYNENSSNYTNRVITLWYRPPELILGATVYGPAIDMWSVGCILAELLAKKPIFPGRNEIDQLDLIFQQCGTPSPEVWPEAEKLPWYNMLRPKRPYKRRLRDLYKDFPEQGLDLVDQLLCLDPKKRISAEVALDHDFFWMDPLPCDKNSLPAYDSSHEFVTKKRRLAQQQQAQAQAQAQQGQTANQTASAQAQSSQNTQQPQPKRPKSSGEPNSNNPRADSRKYDYPRSDNYNTGARSHPDNRQGQHGSGGPPTYYGSANNPTGSQRAPNNKPYASGSSHRGSYNNHNQTGNPSSSRRDSSGPRGNDNHGHPHRTSSGNYEPTISSGSNHSRGSSANHDGSVSGPHGRGPNHNQHRTERDGDRNGGGGSNGGSTGSDRPERSRW
eukprot:TRINITY_DN1922_c0_g1_i4.p1 TRINITY_DN1922_c0_g1~~TRINITY_DN1922_c0_g1_i4.p1  ORF type:complete len:562 (+),score=83.55 TRINITY_DN1922_c0_g1_i4:14-1699(+)